MKKDIYMKEAIKEAEKAYKKNETPIGAVIVKDGKIIASAHNQKERKKSALSHAELNVIKKASKKLKNWRLNDCEIYVTLEPCPMCASAIKQSRIKKVYIGTTNNSELNTKIIEQIFDNNDANGIVGYEYGILEKECSNLLKSFFKDKRK